MQTADEGWRAALTDPFREALLASGAALPQQIPACAAPLRGEPAFDPEIIAHLAEQVRLPTQARFPHPLLERAVRVGLAHIEATFQGDHPRYGVGAYGKPEHDGFPPTIIAAVDALTLWDQTPRAEALLDYWLRRFVRDDGSIAYYGPSLGEYGQLLTTAQRLMARGGIDAWFRAQEDRMTRLAHYLQDLLRSNGPITLLKGVPEADERSQTATYFHNSAWAVRGLNDWASLLETCGDHDASARQARQDAERLRHVLLEAIEAVWPRDPADWWLRPMLEAETDGVWSRPEGRVTANRLGSYTNYRYWPELLSSGVLPKTWMQRIVEARLTGGGQFCGMTRFEDHLDDWPLMDTMEGLWQLGRQGDYRLCLWGHLCYHQAEGHLTAYEQVSFPPGKPVADYCLPSQLVVVRAARRLVGAP
jgi:hypothetical protein